MSLSLAYVWLEYVRMAGKTSHSMDLFVQYVLLDDVTLPIIVTPFDIAVRKLHKGKRRNVDASLSSVNIATFTNPPPRFPDSDGTGLAMTDLNCH